MISDVSSAHLLSPQILREYDIRGIVGDTLETADARAIGQAFGSIVARAGGRRVALGYDGRLSSPQLAEALGDGLRAAGLDVLLVGRGPSPMLYFAVHHLDADAGVMVTGSHNPPDHNGFKFMLGRQPFFGPGIQEIGIIAASAAWHQAAPGLLRQQPVFGDYVARLLRDAKPDRPLTIAWDPGNGAAGEVASALAAKLAGRHCLINAEIDGRFPAHHPDPTVPENLRQLQALVADEQADIGFAFDGDGDRIGIVDAGGGIIWGDQILALLARDVLPRHPGAPIIFDVKSSQMLFDEIHRLGGRPVMWNTGHAPIKRKMLEEKSPLAGEMSAHIFIADGYYGFDDALYVALRFLNLAAATPGGARKLRESLPRLYNTPEVRLECGELRKFSLIEALRADLLRDGANMITLDGVRVRHERGWWLLRASNTQPILVARAEAESPAALELLIDEIDGRLAAQGFTGAGLAIRERLQAST